jgi:hypothetical protein
VITAGVTGSDRPFGDRVLMGVPKMPLTCVDQPAPGASSVRTQLLPAAEERACERLDGPGESVPLWAPILMAAWQGCRSGVQGRV